jgi:hypothetical protein
MPGELHQFLSNDHARLEALLTAALRPDGTIDEESYIEFRRGLLRHISMEERVLMPEVRRRRGDSEVERQLHRDHAALAALLVPPPTARELGTIREILDAHNPLEEGEGGFYEVLEELASHDLPEVLQRMHAIAPVPLAPHADSEVTRRSIEQLLREAEDGRRLLRER